MARAGLGSDWKCIFANDLDPKKAASYAENWGDEYLWVGDVAKMALKDLPGAADLAWASFPCQDLSLAGVRAGLRGERSGTFWPFWGLIQALVSEDRAPRLIVLENVLGALTSHGGKDFATIGDALTEAGYRFGAVVINAVYFVPQSRPRLFIIGVLENIEIPEDLVALGPESMWHPSALGIAGSRLTMKASHNWVWWKLPPPPKQKQTFADLIEKDPKGAVWHSSAETSRLLGMMTEINLNKVRIVQSIGRRMVGGVYKRTRNSVQRAEVRFDDISGCLRTPSGGSSRQTILIVEGKVIRSRLLSPREAARLMGLPDTYKLPERYNDAYHLIGDGLVAPVVRYLAEHILEPLLEANGAAVRAA